MMSEALAAIPAAFVVTLLAIELIRRSSLARRLVDRPNERSLHQRPTPRIGGLGLLAGALAAIVLFGESTGVSLAAVALALAAVSAADDAESLPVATRLGAHLCAAMVAVAIIGPFAQLSLCGSVGAAFAALLAITWLLTATA